MTPPVYRLKTGCCGSRLPNCVKNGTLGGSKPNGSPSPISALSRSPAPAPASGRACSAARATALADSDESIEKIVAVSQHIRKNSVDLKIFLVFFSLAVRSEEHTSELQSLMRISYAVFCLKKKKTINHIHQSQHVLHNTKHNIKNFIHIKSLFNTKQTTPHQ